MNQGDAEMCREAKTSACFHFEPADTEWSARDIADFVELMLTGGVGESSKQKKEITTLAQSKIRNIGEKSGTPIDRVAMLVARKLTCRICGKLDFCVQSDRGKHETQCKKEQQRLEREKRNAAVDAKIFARSLEGNG